MHRTIPFLAFLFSVTVLAKEGWVMFDHKGNITNLNHEAFQYRDRDRWQDFSLDACRSPFESLMSFRVKSVIGRSVFDFFTEPKIQESIMNVLQNQESTIKIIIPEQGILEVKSQYRIYNYHSFYLNQDRIYLGEISLQYIPGNLHAHRSNNFHQSSQYSAEKVSLSLAESSGETLTYQHLFLYPQRHAVFLGDQRIPLNPAEFTILYKLAREPRERASPLRYPSTISPKNTTIPL